MKRALTVIACVGALSFANVATADEAGALVVYNEALKLMEEQRYDEACPRFEASFRMAHTVRAKMAVGLCHERAGRIATAWATYSEAARLARQANDLLARDAAQARAVALEPRMPRLLLVGGRRAVGVTVQLDGEVRPNATIEQALPVDPGRHVVRVEADGHRSFERVVTLAEGESIAVEIAPLETSNTRPSPGPPRVAHGREPMPWWGWGAFGLAAVSTGLGVGFGLSAISADDRAHELCSTDPCAVRDGVDASDRANAHAWVANVAVASAVVLVGTGIVAWVTRPSTATPAAVRSPATFRF